MISPLFHDDFMMLVVWMDVDMDMCVCVCITQYEITKNVYL